MSAAAVSLTTILSIVAIGAALGFLAGVHRKMDLEQWTVGGRGFGVVLIFLLMAGDTFLRRLVEVLPRFKNKRQAVEISQQIESDISAYLMTITVMNLAVGIAEGARLNWTTPNAVCPSAETCPGTW